MTFTCDGCDLPRPEGDLKRCVADKNTLYRYCRHCVSSTVSVPDVFFDGKPEINLQDGPDGKPRVFGSKGEKAAYLKSRGLQEAGDPVRGAPVTFAQNQNRRPNDSKHEAAMALKYVREMGKDVRRQAFLKVVKEARAAQEAARHAQR